MKPEEFCYWLQGFLEMSDTKTMNAKQVAMLKSHLALVFEHVIDPSYVSHLPPDERKARMERLQNIHDGREPEEDEEDKVIAESLRPRLHPTYDPHRRIYKC